jgi:hypothetical protein
MVLSSPLPNRFQMCKTAPKYTDLLRMPRYRYGPPRKNQKA